MTNITLFDETFNLIYIIFGSKTSLDLDIIIWIPKHLTILLPHEYIKTAKIADEKISHILNIDKKVNSCFGHWDIDDIHNNTNLLWCQKGTIEETNNSIIYTYYNHNQNQIISLPFNKLLNRNIKLKIMTSIRTSIGKLSRTSVDRPLLDNIIFKYIMNKQFDIQYLPHIFSGNSCNNTQRNMLVKQLLFNLEQQNTRSDSQVIILKSDISDIIDMLDNKDIYRKLVRYTMKMRTLGIALELLSIDFRLLSFPRNIDDRLKTISFQLGQSLGLIDNIELFDKQTISDKYPILQEFLFRNHNNINNINIFIHNFIQRVRNFGLEMTDTELIY